MLKPWPTCLPHSDPETKARKLDFTYWGLYPSPGDGETVRGIMAAVLFCVYKAPSSVGSLRSIGCIGPEHTGWKYHSEGSWSKHLLGMRGARPVTTMPMGLMQDQGGLSGHGGSILPSLGMTVTSRWYSGVCVCVLLKYKISLEGYPRTW